MKFVYACLSLLLLAGIAIASPCRAQANIVTNNIEPSANATIVKFYVEQIPGAPIYNKSGPIHIAYSDGTEFIEQPMPNDSDEDGGKRISDVKLSADKKTLGWTEGSLPLTLVIFRSGKVIKRLEKLMVYDWNFVKGGKQVFVQWGMVHDINYVDYQLVDTKTGKMISEYDGNSNDPDFEANTPKWAK